MPEYAMPEIGSFCWTELHTSDTNAARGFYGELFGWKLEDMPMPMGSYTMATLNGKHIAGLTKTPAEATKMGAPPAAWQVYIAVADVKASAAAAAKLGGKVLVDATPMGPGTFAVIQDPTGGVFHLWHTTQSMGTFVKGEPGSLNWTELLTTDVAAAQEFYTKLFGWTAETQQMPTGPYTLFKQGGDFVAGVMVQPPGMKGAPAMWATYFCVSDADASMAKATKLGAKTLMPVIEVANVGRFGWLSDPQGGAFAVMQNASTST